MRKNKSINYSIVESILESPAPGQSLYHYTSTPGLLGILESRKLWCSQIYFLNDYEENLTIWKFFFDCVDKWNSLFGQSDEFKEALRNAFSHYGIFNKEAISLDVFSEFRISDYNLFVFSLSHVEDDLSQWRGYTDGAFGFSLELNLQEFIGNQPFYKDTSTGKDANCRILIKNCIYSDEKKVDAINGLLLYAIQKFIKGDKDWHREIFFHLLTLNIFFKNAKFENEKECRIAVLPDEYSFAKKKMNMGLKFRVGKSFLIPYLELGLPARSISSVRVGPAPFPHHSLAALVMLQQQNKDYLKHVRFTISKVPFRNW